MRKIQVRPMGPELIKAYYRYGEQIDGDKTKPSACLTRLAEEWSKYGPRAEVVICSQKPGGSDSYEPTSTGYVLIDGEPHARTTVTKEERAAKFICVPYPEVDHSKK